MDPRELLKNLVDINTFSTNQEGIYECLSFVEKFLSSYNLNTKIVKSSNGVPTLLAATKKSEREKASLFLCHIDTVHPKESVFKKFSEEGEFYCGPGTADMKGGVVVAISVIDQLSKKNLLDAIPLIFCLTSDEELDSDGGKEIFMNLGEELKEAFVFEWGREGNRVITQRKGVGSFKIKCIGKEAHSGNSHREGRNSIVRLSEVIPLIQALTDYDKGITLSAGIIKGGTAINTVPGECKVEFDFRVIKSVDKEIVERKILDILTSHSTDEYKLLFTPLTFRPPLEETEKSKELFLEYKKTAQELGENIEPTDGIVGGGSDGNFIASLGVPVLDGLGPIGFGGHTSSERILIKSLEMRAKILGRLFEKRCF